MEREHVITVDPEEPIWERVFIVSPLVVVGTREGAGFNLAPKHLAMPLSRRGHFGFVCEAAHATYHNAKEAGCFTVSYPRPEQIAMASLAAAPREDDGAAQKPVLSALPTMPATKVDGVFLEDAYLMLECELHEVIEGLGDNALLIGRIVAAHVHEDALRVFDGDDQKLIYESPLLAFVSPGRYAVVQETQAFPFPANFHH